MSVIWSMTDPSRKRVAVALVGMLVLAMILISGYTLRLLGTQRLVLEDTIRESRAHALALLSSRLEEALYSEIRPAFHALNNIEPGTVDQTMFEVLRRTSPELEQIIYLDPGMKARRSFPQPDTVKERVFTEWVSQRLRLEGRGKIAGPFSPHTFIETIDRHPKLFAVQRASEIHSTAGWLLMRFDLDRLAGRRFTPLFAAFSKDNDGPVRLQDADAPWDENAFTLPATHLLPGWMLEFKPSQRAEQEAVAREDAAVLGLTAAVIVTLFMATFLAWREIRREHALVDLRNRFVANVSHELKTPLTLIRLYTETLVLNRVTEPERQRDYHRTILREAERLSRMIDTVLDFSRLTQSPDVYPLTENDLGATVTRVCSDYIATLSERGLVLGAEVAPNLPAVAHNPNGVRQILLNLLDNSAKFAASGGKVHVTLQPQGNTVELAVTDFGPGIADHEIDAVRQAFHRGSAAERIAGTGLGLALVDQIAKAHHAEIVLGRPKGGMGLKATVVFPVSAVRA